jgi:hypothetical protein
MKIFSRHKWRWTEPRMSPSCTSTATHHSWTGTAGCAKRFTICSQLTKGGGIEGADARQSAARSTAPRRTHAQTTLSCWNTLAPAGEASRPPTASVYRKKQELDADGGSAVVGDAIAIGGLGLRPPRRRLAGSACCSHASLLD